MRGVRVIEGDLPNAARTDPLLGILRVQQFQGERILIMIIVVSRQSQWRRRRDDEYLLTTPDNKEKKLGLISLLVHHTTAHLIKKSSGYNQPHR